MPQRRYTEEQKQRIVQSGEAPPEDMGLISRIARNALIAVPRALTDTASVIGMVGPAVRAGLSSEVDFPEAMYGKEGVEELSTYVQMQTQDLLSQLPEERRTERNAEAIANQVANSSSAEEIRLRRGPIGVRQGTEAGNFLNEQVGLPPVRGETITDDAAQIAATALVPSSIVTRGLAKAGTSAATKAARVAADVLVPGTAKYTPAGVALNTVVPLGASQALRAATDQPSVITGEAFGPDLGVTAAYEAEPVDPEAGMGGEQMGALAGAIGGLGLAATVLSGKANKVATKAVLDEIDGGVTTPRLDTPETDIPDGASVVVVGGKMFTGDRHSDALGKAVKQFGPDSPEIKEFDSLDDPMTAIGVYARGRKSGMPDGFKPGVSGGAKTRTSADATMPDPTKPLPPTLSRGQRLKSAAVEATAPLRDTLSNAYGKDAVRAKSAIDNVDRVITETAHVNMNTAHVNAMQLGNIPGLDRKSVPLSGVERALSELPQPDVDLFNKYMVSKTLLDRHALKLKSIEDEMRDAQLGISTGKSNLAQVKAIEQKKIATQSPDAPLTDALSVKQAQEIVTQAEVNPKLMMIESQLRKLESDILEAKIKDGQLSQVTVDKLKKAHPNHMMLQEDPNAGKGTIGRWWEAIKNESQGSKLPNMYGNVRGPLLGSGGGKQVDNPMSAINSYKQYLYDHIQYTKQNDATRTYVNAIKESGDFGRSIREIESMSLEEFSMKGEPSKVEKIKNKFAYTENGRIHFMEAADPETLRALQFSAPSTVMVGNALRKLYQRGTTGEFAPEFAPTAALFEDVIARTTRQPGRSYGIFDATARRAFPNSEAVSRVLDTFGGTIGPINTSQVQMVAGLFQQIRYNDLRNAGMKIAADLEQGSGIFNLLAKAPGGKQILQNASEAFLRSYNESRYGVFVNLGVKQSNLLDDPLKQVREGYNAASYSSTALRPVNYFAQQYKNMLEMVHNSSKYAFFAQNYAALQRKYPNGVPKHEAEKLASETKSLSGDMTRSVGNPYFGKVLSTIPYGQIAVNSTYHLASAIKHDPTTVGARILSGVILPKISAIAMISSIPALAEWYWNEIPAWQRMSKIPVIGPDWWIDQANGKSRELTPNDIYMMPEAPEMTLISNPMITFLRSMGAFGSDPQTNAAFGKELGEGMEGVTSIATPPIIGMLAAGMRVDFGRLITSPLTGKPIIEEAYNENPHQGGNPTGINADSDISRAFAHGLTSLFGVAVGNLLNSVDVGIQASEDDQFNIALSKAFEFHAYQSERRLPELPGTREAGAYLYTDGQRRHYASTQRRERVVEMTQAFEPIAMQLSADKDRSGSNAWAEGQGLEGLKKIADPKVRALADKMYKVFRAGKMKKLQDDRSELNKKLARVEANKENITPRQYHEMSNGIQTEINDVNKMQEESIMQLESSLLHQYDIDIEGAIEIIKQSISR